MSVFYVLTDDGKTCRVGTAKSAEGAARRLQSGNPRTLEVELEVEVEDTQMLLSSVLAWYGPDVLPTGWIAAPAADVVALVRRELSTRAARYGDRRDRDAVMVADSEFRHALRASRGF